MSDLQRAGSQPTVLTDIQIPFWRLVAIFIKFFVASIPAIIVIWIILAAIMFVLASILGQDFFSFIVRRPQM